MANGPQIQPEIGLIATPWPILNRPSLQLAALKAYVEHHVDCRVAAMHPYLQIAKAIGTDVYTAIAENSWAGEAIFASLLYPEQQEGCRKTFAEYMAGNKNLHLDFHQLRTILRDTCDGWLQSVPWSTLQLVGFSLCFNQLFSSLYLSAKLKQLPESPPVVFGGSSCAGELGTSLLQNFSQIDYVVDGEGEQPLAGLCSYLLGTTSRLPERVRSGGNRQHHQRIPSPEVADLNDLPIPDFSPYFQEMLRVFPDTPFIPILPVEFSRGCWWNKCAFCNLNLQWCSYRWKNNETVLTQIEELANRHQCLDFTFTDNALPPKEADTFFRTMAANGTDARFFAEIRSITDHAKLATYRRGGLDTIQVGIEALSSSLLARMEKGLRAIDNIAMLKYAQAADIRLEGNLIMEFPGTTAAEVAETLENLDYVLPYHPLSPATFFLGHGSPIDRNPRKYKITAITHHRCNRRFFPPAILKHLSLLVKEYRGDRQRQRRLWQPVRRKLEAWQTFHTRRTSHLAPLSYRDGKTFLLIRQEMAQGPPLRHRLQGQSRAIYLFCVKIRTIEEITSRFSALKRSAILTFIDQLCRKRLMFQEDDSVLSLAVHQR